NSEQDLLLDPAQSQVPLSVDNLLQRFPAGSLDEEIGIEKSAAGQFGQNNAHRAFAGAGHADQDNIGCCPHHEKITFPRIPQPVQDLHGHNSHFILKSSGARSFALTTRFTTIHPQITGKFSSLPSPVTSAA